MYPGCQGCYDALVTWFRKEQPTPFDAAPIPGLFFLDGSHAVLSHHKEDWTDGFKYPMVAFPSGQAYVLREGVEPGSATVHLFGAVGLPLAATCEQATCAASEAGCEVEKVDGNRLEIHGQEPHEHYRVTYAQEGTLANVEWLAPRWATLYP